MASPALREAVLRASPALAPVIATMPEATGPTANGLVGAYSRLENLKIREDTATVKIDRRFKSADTAYVRVNVNDTRVTGPLFSTQASALGLRDGQDIPVRTTNVAVGDQHVWTARLLNELSAGIQRVVTGLITDGSPLPMIAVTGLTIAPGSRGRSVTANTSYQAGDHMTYSTGVHTVKWGGAWRQVRLAQRSGDFAILSYTSLDDFIRNTAAVASLVSGNPGSATYGRETAAWLQDTWRVRPAVTVDYGVRYDYFGPPFDPQRRTRVYDVRDAALAPAGSPYFEPNATNFSPRVAVAWQPRSRVALRIGYGVFFQAYPVGLGANIVNNTLRGTTTLRQSQLPGLGFPLPALELLGTAAKPGVTGFELHKPDLYSEQWSLTAEWDAGRGNVLRTTYTGSRGLHLRRTLNLNLVDRASGRPPNSEFSSILLETASGKSNYQALELRWTRRFQPRLTGAAAYTWSHALDDVPDPAVTASPQPQDNSNFRAEWGNGSSDSRHRLSSHLLYELPNGRSIAVRGWMLAAIAQFRSGIPSTVLIGTNTYGNGNYTNQRPDAVADASPYPPARTVDRWWNAAAFRMPAPRTFGNLAPNTVFGPGLSQIDTALLKDTRFEGWNLQFRVEAFNVLNHPNFAAPNNVFGTESFGRIFNTAGKAIGLGTARQIQVALRCWF